MPPASGGGTGGGSNVWGQLLQGVLEGVMQKMAQKTSAAPNATPKDGSKPAEAKPEQNPQQQSAPPMTAAMTDLLAKLSSKMNTQVPQGPPPKGENPAAQTTAGVGAAPPPQQPPQPAAPTPPPPSQSQDSRFKQVLEGIASVLKSPMVSARRGLEYLNKGIDDPDEMIQRGRERGGIGGTLESTAGHGIRGLQQDRSLQGIGDFAGGAGEMTGGPVRSFFKLNEVLLKTVDRLRIWNDRLHEGNIRFAEFSGSMFSVQQQSQNRQDILDMQKGEALAKSAKGLAEEKDKWNQRLFNLDVGWQWVKNTITEKALNLGGKIADLDPTGLLGGAKIPPGQTMHDWMRQVTEDEAKRPGSLIPRPNRWGGV